MKSKALKNMIDKLGPQKTAQQIQEWVAVFESGEPGGYDPRAFSVQEAFIGSVPNAYDCLSDWRHGVMESDAVNTAAFTAISRTVIASLVRSSFANPAFTLTGIVPNEPNSSPDPEIMPEIAPLGDGNQVVGEGQEYPVIGMSENWTERPKHAKRGSTILMTKEVIAKDNTGFIRQEASQLGYWLGLNKELRLLDVLIGYTNTYKRNGTAYNTFQTSTPWVNDQANPISDWTDIDESRLLFSNMRHPDTGLPVFLGTAQIFAAETNRSTINRVLTATTIETGASTDARRTIGGNPVSGMSATYSELLDYQIAVRGLASASNARQWWFHGNIAEAIAYSESMALSVIPAPAEAIGYLSFTRDIVAGFKASEKGIAYVKEPRKIVRNKNS
jgi:hypothetical protein